MIKKLPIIIFSVVVITFLFNASEVAHGQRLAPLKLENSSIAPGHPALPTSPGAPGKDTNPPTNDGEKKGPINQPERPHSPIDLGSKNSGSPFTPPCTTPICYADTTGIVKCQANCNLNEFLLLIQRVITFLLFEIAMPFAAIFFAYAGWLYMSASGNEGKVKQAHDIFFWIIGGFVIALAAWLVISALLVGLGVKSEFNFLGGTSDTGPSCGGTPYADTCVSNGNNPPPPEDDGGPNEKIPPPPTPAPGGPGG